MFPPHTALPQFPKLLPTGRLPADPLIIEVMEEYSTVMQLTAHSGRFWLRLSGSVYNTREDYVRAKEVLVSFCSKYLSE